MKKLKIISVWQPKGGQGKSMIALNLAAAAVEMGIKPLIICQDPQGTSTLYHDGGNLPFEVISKIPDDRPDADIVIFDHMASDWDVPDTKLLIMPVKPSRDQYATYKDARKRAEKVKRQVITVVTDCNHQRPDEVQTRDYMVSEGAFEIPSSGVFSRAASDYRTIFDPALDKAYKVKHRRKELQAILGAILLEENKE